MTAYDVRARASAARVLASIGDGGKGQDVTLKRSTEGAYDPATASAPITTTTQDGSGVELAYSAHSIDGTLIKAGDKRFLLSALNRAGGVLTAPEPDIDKLTLADGSSWVIKKVDPIAPAGLAAVYDLQLRKA